jgi:hypothetical protein
MKALDIIRDAYERCNRLSPGEVLSDDDSSFALRKLNLLVDELSSQNLFLFKENITSNPQFGNITLGSGAWASVDPGSEVVSATANNLALSPITMRQYNELYQPTVTGTPSVWASDGLSTVYLWPVPNGQTIKLETRATASDFADLNTDYALPSGYKAALGAGLAVRLAVTICANGPSAAMLKAERSAMDNINHYEPAIINTSSFTGGRIYFPPRLF